MRRKSSFSVEMSNEVWADKECFVCVRHERRTMKSRTTGTENCSRSETWFLLCKQGEPSSIICQRLSCQWRLLRSQPWNQLNFISLVSLPIYMRNNEKINSVAKHWAKANRTFRELWALEIKLKWAVLFILVAPQIRSVCKLGVPFCIFSFSASTTKAIKNSLIRHFSPTRF